MLTSYFVIVTIVAIGWAGVNELTARFTAQDPLTLGNRTIIWKNTLHIAREFPLFGTGLNTYGASMLFYQTVMPEKHLAQAHNDYLQLLAEGGILVMFPAAVAALVIARIVRQRFREVVRESTEYWIRIGTVTGLVAIGLQEIGDFSLQMPGNALLFVVLLAIALRPVEAVVIGPRQGAMRRSLGKYAR
jgi:O-antigen ligase